MYFYVVYQIPEAFEKFSKLGDFWQKNGNFLRFSHFNIGTTFSMEMKNNVLLMCYLISSICFATEINTMLNEIDKVTIQSKIK